jgi:hypothetical protein
MQPAGKETQRTLPSRDRKGKSNEQYHRGRNGQSNEQSKRGNVPRNDEVSREGSEREMCPWAISKYFGD